MMILDFNMLNVSITVLVVLFVFVCLMMVLLVLMQRPKQEGLGAAFGAGTTDQLFGARTTSVLQRGTVYLAVLFFVIAFTLAVLLQRKNSVESLTNAEKDPAVVVEAPAPEPKSLNDELNPAVPVTVTPGETTTVDVAAPPVTPPAEPQPEGDKPAEQSAPEVKTETEAPAPPAETDKTPQP
jgi:preprotein translocase subunit SecG